MRKCDKCGTETNLYLAIKRPDEPVIPKQYRCGFCIEDNKYINGKVMTWIPTYSQEKDEEIRV
jgi:hypothetical protein